MFYSECILQCEKYFSVLLSIPRNFEFLFRALTKDDILNFVDDHYKPARMVLTGVGGVNHTQLTELSEKYFGHLKNEYKRKIPEKTGVRFTGSEFLYRDDSYPLMFGAIAVEGVRRADLDYIPLMVGRCFSYFLMSHIQKIVLKETIKNLFKEKWSL